MLVPDVPPHGADPAPADQLGAAVFSAVFCFPPTGVAAVFHALRARDRLEYGDLPGAALSSGQARRFAIASVALGGLFYLGVFLLAFVVGAA